MHNKTPGVNLAVVDTANILTLTEGGTSTARYRVEGFSGIQSIYLRPRAVEVFPVAACLEGPQSCFWFDILKNGDVENDTTGLDAGDIEAILAYGIGMRLTGRKLEAEERHIDSK